MTPGNNVRVGDADREAVVAQLREHYADGRLTLEELNERIDQTFAAKTKADLNIVMRDLPQASRPGAGLPYAGTGWPGQAGSPGWQGPGWHGPMSPGPGQRHDQGGQSRGPGAFAPLLGVVWLLVILGSVMIFGLGGDRPFAIVLFLAALALVRRLFGLGGRRGGSRGPRGPRGPRGRRRF